MPILDTFICTYGRILCIICESVIVIIILMNTLMIVICTCFIFDIVSCSVVFLDCFTILNPEPCRIRVLFRSRSCITIQYATIRVNCDDIPSLLPFGIENQVSGRHCTERIRIAFAVFILIPSLENACGTIYNSFCFINNKPSGCFISNVSAKVNIIFAGIFKLYTL